MGIDWKNDRRVHFALGVGLIWLAATWVLPWTFTAQSLELAANDWQRPVEVLTEDGMTRTELVPASGFVSFVLPFMEQLVAIIAGLGAWAISSAFWVRDQLAKPAESPAVQPALQAAAAEPAKAEVDPAALTKKLIQAAALNDQQALSSAAAQVRIPYAERDASRAIRARDYTAARAAIDELEALHAPPKAKPTRTKGGA